MYRCIDCGAIFEDPVTWKESRGEYWGFPCSETMSGCPECEGDYEEALECKECGKWHSKEELDDGLCEACINEKEKNNDNV